MLSRIFTVDSVTLTSTGTAVSTYVPYDPTTRKLPTQVVVKATGQGAYVRLSDDQSAATNADVLVQAGDHVVLSVGGRHWVSVLSDGASSTVNIGALSTGVWGDAATLNLDFTPGTLDSRITFTRADASTCASFVDRNGVLQLAAANVPRFDYDPATGAAKGLLIEETRQNLLLQSSTFTTTWVPSAAATYTRNAPAPDGTFNATYIVEDTSASNRATRQDVTSTGSSTHCLTVYARPISGSQRYLGVRLANAASPTTNYFQAAFNLNNGTLSDTLFSLGDATGASATITNAGNGWYRIALIGVPSTSATSVRCSFFVANAATTVAPSYTGDGASGLILWGAQLEVGAFPTSYIPTTTTAVTRAADSATITTLSPWFNASEGTLFAQADSYDVSAARISFYVNDGTTNNRIHTGHGAAPRGFIATGGVTQLTQSPNGASISSNTSSKVALAYKANDGQTAVNGTAAVVVTTLSVPTVNTARLGGITVANANLNGHLQRIAYYPRRLDQTTLQNLTT